MSAPKPEPKPHVHKYGKPESQGYGRGLHVWKRYCECGSFIATKALPRV